MERMTGTVVRGIRTPIINCGDDLIQIVSDSIIKASQIEGFPIRYRDIAAITESVVARAQGNYADIDAIAADVRSKFGDVTSEWYSHPQQETACVCLRGMPGV